MEKFIDRLIREFESGALGRRELVQTLGIAAAVFAAGPPANAAPAGPGLKGGGADPQANAAPAGRGLKGLGINHISYQCPDYKKARDWYSSMFGMQVTNDK